MTDENTQARLWVAVRSHRGGVHMGVLEIECPVPGMVRLLDARSVWRWEGALGVAGLAVVGPSGGSISSPHEVWLRIDDICAVHVCTSDAVARFAAVGASDDRA